MKCELPKFSDSFFEDHLIECSHNRYNSLNDTDQENENSDSPIQNPPTQVIGSINHQRNSGDTEQKLRPLKVVMKDTNKKLELFKRLSNRGQI